MSSNLDPAAAEQNVERLIRTWADPVRDDDVLRACETFREKLRSSAPPPAVPRKGPQVLLVAAALLGCLGVVVWTMSSRPASEGSMPAGSQEESVPDAKLDAWVRELSGDDVDARDRAQKALVEAAHRDPTVDVRLERRIEGETDSEVRGRLRDVLVRTRIEERAVIDSPQSVTSAALSPNGDRVATVDITGQIRLWTLSPLREVASESVNKSGRFSWQRGFIGKIVFTPDGKELVMAAMGTGVRYDAGTLKELGAFMLPPYSYGWPFDVRADGGALLCTEGLRELVLFDFKGVNQAVFAAAGGGLFSSARFSPDGTLVIATQGPKLLLLDGKTLRQVEAVALPGGILHNAAISDDGTRWVTTAMNPDEIGVGDIKTRTPTARLAFRSKGDWSSRFLRMVGRLVFAETEDGSLLIAEWNGLKGTLVPLRTLKEGKLNEFAFSRDGRRFLVVSRTVPKGPIRVYEVKAP